MKSIDLVRHPLFSGWSNTSAREDSILAHRGRIRDLDSGRPCAQPYLLSQLTPDNMLGPHVEPAANTFDCRLYGCIGKPAHQAQDPVCLSLRIAWLFTLGLRRRPRMEISELIPDTREPVHQPDCGFEVA